MTDQLTIVTNHVPRFVIESHELTKDEQSEFDYLDWPAIERGEDSRQFFRYRGQLYDLGEFETTERYQLARQGWLKGWHGIQPDSFFSGLLIKWPTEDWSSSALDFERIIIARYYC
jgi:hypothetical protein